MIGNCEFPTAELRRHEPQGFNLRDLLLDKVVQAPPGPAATVVTEIELRYEEEVTVGPSTR